MKRVGIYLRIGTDSQTTENQRRELEAVAARSGWQVAGDRSVACSIDRDSQHLLGRARESWARAANETRHSPDRLDRN